MTDLISRGATDTAALTAVTAPAYSNMQQCLRLQADAKPRGWFARAIGKNPLHPSARAAFAGALGERAVAHILAELGSNWSILREATVGTGSSGADYLVVGPPGIFTISTEHFERGKLVVQGASVTLDGVETGLAQTSLGEASRAERQLADASRTNVSVKPLLVVAGGAALRVGKQPLVVAVIRSTELRRWFLDRMRTVSDDTISYFAHVALRSGNWNRQVSVSGDVVRHVQRFERLQQEIAEARKRLHVVILSCAALVTIAAVVAIATFASH